MSARNTAHLPVAFFKDSFEVTKQLFAKLDWTKVVSLDHFV